MDGGKAALVRGRGWFSGVVGSGIVGGGRRRGPGGESEDHITADVARAVCGVGVEEPSPLKGVACPHLQSYTNLEHAENERCLLCSLVNYLRENKSSSPDRQPMRNRKLTRLALLVSRPAGVG